MLETAAGMNLISFTEPILKHKVNLPEKNVGLVAVPIMYVLMSQFGYKIICLLN